MGASSRSNRLATIIIGLVASIGIALAAAGTSSAVPALSAAAASARLDADATVAHAGMARGIDVSGWQGDIRWPHVANGASFVYVKATEGLGFVSSSYEAQYGGAKANGMYAGSYAFGRPDGGAPEAQADYFIDHANLTPDATGRASATDRKTLPPMLDIEWPYTHNGRLVASYPCYGLSQSDMVAWIKGFVDEVKARTGSVTTIYTAAGWWNTCTGGSAAFADQPLFVASYNKGTPHLPHGWTQWTIWQYNDKGRLPGDQNRFNGPAAELAGLAMAPSATPNPIAARSVTAQSVTSQTILSPATAP